MKDRILEIVDLLLGAAYADKDYRPEEEKTVRKLLGDLLGDPKLPDQVEAQLRAFTRETFDIDEAAAAFIDDAPEQKLKLLELVAAVHDADEEVHLDEDQYLKDLADSVGVPHDDIKHLTLHVEVEALRVSFAELRKTPPPLPR